MSMVRHFADLKQQKAINRIRSEALKRAWEDENAAQRKLGEEAQLTMGQSPNSENYTEDGEHDKFV